MNIFKPDKLQYELKCRRCGSLKIITHLPFSSNHAYVSFAREMKRKSIIPETASCNECKLWTVHELTCFSQPVYIENDFN